jgi:pimeloyl-ACP methyl ester carboxylesterase
MRRLESSFHLVGIDLSGHGSSAFPPSAPLSLDLYAEDVRTAMDALDLDCAHVFGFSLGGGVALRLAHQSPDRVERLALLQTNVQLTEKSIRQLRAFVDTLPSASRAMTETLSDISAPTLVGAVDQDPLFGLDSTRRLHQQLPASRLAILPGDHHSLTHAPLTLLAPLLRTHFLSDS